ncbi:YHYH domain-containing protein [Methylophilus sp.]|nr:MAG: YHYH domain-containing protein [Methylophilus sp.]
MKGIIAGVAVCIIVCSSFASAHSGGTDKNGCHHDRQTGTYHCH